MSAAQWNSTLCWYIPSLVHSAFNIFINTATVTYVSCWHQCYMVTFTIGNFSSLVHAQQFPQPPYREDLFLSFMSFFLPFLLVLSFLYSAGVFVKVIVGLNIHHLQYKVRTDVFYTVFSHMWTVCVKVVVWLLCQPLLWPTLVPRLSPHVNKKFVLQATENWAGPGNEANCDHFCAFGVHVSWMCIGQVKT